jgi:hypothetical protein
MVSSALMSETTFFISHLQLRQTARKWVGCLVGHVVCFVYARTRYESARAGLGCASLAI